VRDRTLVLLRGLPGSGKTELARTLAPGACYAADDFFEQDGGYDFDPAKLGEAHASCQERTEDAMAQGEPVIVVHNTFSQAWEARVYYALAANYAYSVYVIEVQNDFGNTHGVPDAVIERMRVRWEPLDRDPVPIWRLARHRFQSWWRRTRKAWRGK
jgi:predicted kinase